MNEVIAPLILLLVVIWPLLLVAVVSFAAMRSVAVRLVPWATLPALAAALALSETTVQLPVVMMGSSLVLDDTGRVFLLLNATLWMATGLLARPLHSVGARHFAVLLLLTMVGGFGMALAGGALLFFASSTLAGYAMYGLLVHEADVSAQKACRVLVVLLVISDLLVFELLLILGYAAGSVEFAMLRQVFVSNDNRVLMLGLLIAGFGIRAGVLGLHFWLVPVFISAVPAVRPALIGFMLSAGLLGWLRLLPLGDIHWAGAGLVLQWLAWFTLGYAVIMALFQFHSRSILASAALALTGLWLGVLGAVLLRPQVWNGISEVVLASVLQSGFSLAALLLLLRRTDGSVAARLRRYSAGLMWLAALLLAATPVGITGFLAKIDGMAAWQLSLATAAITYIAARALLVVAPADPSDRSVVASPHDVQQAAKVSTDMILLVAGGLTTAALLAAIFKLAGLSLAELWQPALVVSAGVVAARLSAKWRIPKRPAMPAGGLLMTISRRLAATIKMIQRLADTRLPLWRDTARGLLWRLWSGMDWRRMAERIESGLNRWRTVLLLLLLLGLVVAWLAGSR